MTGTNGLHDRLEAAAGDRTYRDLALMTATNPETVRRYMQGQAPSAEFLAALCGALGVSGDWLLTGRGPMLASDVEGHALRRASASDLLTAMSDSVERLMDRMERVELFVNTIEVKLRAAREGKADEHRNGERVSAIADAVAQRPPQAPR